MKKLLDRILNTVFPLRQKMIEDSLEAGAAAKDALYELRQLRHEMQIRRAVEINDAARRMRERIPPRDHAVD